MTNIQFHSGAIDAGECVSAGWNLIKPNYWMFFAVTLVGVLLISCIPCVNIFVIGPVGVGIYYVLLRSMRGEPVEFGMMFKGFEKFVPAMVVGLIQAFPGIVWTIVDYTVNFATLIPALSRGGDLSDLQRGADIFGAGFSIGYTLFALTFAVVSAVWGISFMFALPLLAEHDLNPIDALKLSASAAWSNIGGIILLVVLQVLLAIVGLLALCVGVLFVLPVLYASFAVAYRQVFPMVDQHFNYAPPPPTEYGGFGSGMN